jgi:RNA recognition motif-containing protein
LYRLHQDRSFPQREELPLPTAPPYISFVGNLAFDLTEIDLEQFFSPIKVKSVKLIRDREEKPKGFGYVEFDTLDGLKDGLLKTGGVSINVLSSLFY